MEVRKGCVWKRAASLDDGLERPKGDNKDEVLMNRVSGET